MKTRQSQVAHMVLILIMLVVVPVAGRSQDSTGRLLLPFFSGDNLPESERASNLAHTPRSAGSESDEPVAEPAPELTILSAAVPTYTFNSTHVASPLLMETVPITPQSMPGPSLESVKIAHTKWR